MSGCDWFNVYNVALATNKNLSFRLAAIKCRCIGVDYVGKDVVIEMVNIESWIRCMEASEEVAAG